MFLRSLDAQNVVLLADLFHMNIEESSIASAIMEAGDRIGYVHFVDSNQRPVGCGHTQMPPVIDALKQVGFDGYLAARAMPFPDPDTAARATMEAFHVLVGGSTARL